MVCTWLGLGVLKGRCHDCRCTAKPGEDAGHGQHHTQVLLSERPYKRQVEPMTSRSDGQISRAWAQVCRSAALSLHRNRPKTSARGQTGQHHKRPWREGERGLAGPPSQSSKKRRTMPPTVSELPTLERISPARRHYAADRTKKVCSPFQKQRTQKFHTRQGTQKLVNPHHHTAKP